MVFKLEVLFAVSQGGSQPEFIRVRRELHPWMNGILAVFKNSHHVVTDSRGAFSLPNLPPGKYTITAWHETYGT